MENNTDKTLQEILSLVQNVDKRLIALESESVPGATINQVEATQKKVSAKEFLLERKPKGAVQTALAVGYYLEKCEAVVSFNKDDIEKIYRSAKMSPPANINDKVNMCIRAGYMMESEDKKDNKKAWVLTLLGEKYVEVSFNKKKL